MSTPSVGSSPPPPPPSGGSGNLGGGNMSSLGSFGGLGSGQQGPMQAIQQAVQQLNNLLQGMGLGGDSSQGLNGGNQPPIVRQLHGSTLPDGSHLPPDSCNNGGNNGNNGNYNNGGNNGNNGNYNNGGNNGNNGNVNNGGNNGNNGNVNNGGNNGNNGNYNNGGNSGNNGNYNNGGNSGNNGGGSQGVATDPGIPAGATNVAGRDNLDFNKPIYVPMVNGDYDPKAIQAIGDQSLQQAGMTQSQAQSDRPHHGDAGQADGSYTIANGYAAGIRDGAAAIYGANANGYTSLQDHQYALTQGHVETGQDDGTLNPTQNMHQQHVEPGAGSDGQGPIQIDGQYHDQTDANMPVVAYTRAYGAARQLGGTGDLRTDGLAYNQGFVGGQGQNVGHEGVQQSYGAYWDQLVQRLQSGNFQRTDS